MSLLLCLYPCILPHPLINSLGLPAPVTAGGAADNSTYWQMYHARDMADTVTTQETGIVFIGSQHWAQLLGFREEICVKTQLLPLCRCCRLYRRVSMWQQSHYRTMVQGISGAGVTDLSPPSQSWSQQMKGKYCSRWWIWIVETRIRIYRYAGTFLQHTTVQWFEK